MALTDIVHEKPDCQFGHWLHPINGTFSVNELDGSLVTSDFTVPFMQYCVDHFTNLKSHENDLGDEPVVKVLLCFNDTQESDQQMDTHGLHEISAAFATVIGIASVLSAISIAVAAMVSSFLKKVQQVCITTHTYFKMCKQWRGDRSC